MFLIPMTYRHSKGFSEMLLEVKKNKDEGKLRISKLTGFFSHYFPGWWDLLIWQLPSGEDSEIWLPPVLISELIIFPA